MQNFSVTKVVSDLVPALLAYFDRGERCHYVNQSFAHWMGGDPQKFVGKLANEILAFEIFEKRRGDIACVLQGQDVSFETHMTDSQGAPAHKIITYRPDIDESSKVRGFIVHIANNEGLSQEEDRFLQLAQNLQNQVIHIMDLNPVRTSYISPSFEKIWGRSINEIFENPLSLLDTIHPEDRHIVNEALRRQELGQSTNISYRIIRPNGDIRWIQDATSLVKNSSGKPIRSTGIAEDVTERRATAAALTFERQMLETIFKEAPAAMTLWRGPKFVFDKVNPTYQAIFPDRQLVGREFLEACPEFKGQPFFDILTKVFETGEPFIAKEMYAPHARSLGGQVEDVYYNFTYVRVNDPNGQPYGVFDHAYDVTDLVLARKKIEENEIRLTKAKEEAERASHFKTAFLANMSHEIRTPMAAVLGFTEILRIPEIRESKRVDALERIDRSGRSLLKLIDDILDISKIEAGRLVVEKTRFSPLEVVNEVVALLQLQAEKKGLKIEMKLHPSAPELAHSDPARLRQILINLVGNAIKFTLQGKVVIHAGSETDSSSGLPNLYFDVSDTGIGIGDQDQKKLFLPFSQADESITRKFGGSGLGLALSKRLCQQLGGDLLLSESTVGKGSRFTAKVDANPFEKLSDAEAVAKIEALQTPLSEVHKNALQAARILIVDDVVDNQLLNRLFLESEGAIVDVANDGAEAIAKATKFNYDVILMDIQMPNVDGIQATKKLRSLGYVRPILALTAHALREEVTRSMEAGCNDHLIKPVNRGGLISAVQKYFKHQQ